MEIQEKNHKCLKKQWNLIYKSNKLLIVLAKKYFKSKSGKNPKCMSSISIKPNDFLKIKCRNYLIKLVHILKE